MDKIYITWMTDEIMNMVRDLAFEYGDHIKNLTLGEESSYRLIRSKKWRELKMQVSEEIESTCDHKMVKIDDSFDHEFGTEKAFHLECSKCGAECGS